MNLIIIAGPTASGKTAVALELAKMLKDVEIISADSRQVFKLMDIGTAKPESEEIEIAPHHFIDILNPDEYYSAGKFGDDAYSKINKISNNGRIPIVVGGSGLYIKALVEGFFSEEVRIDDDIKKSLQEILDIQGRDVLFRMLLDKDPESASKYNDKNPMRIMRALEYYLATGNKFSNAQRNMPERKIKPYYFAIEQDRDLLYSRINTRTLKMIEKGLIQETEKLLELGFSPKLNSLNTVGYKEIIDFLQNKISLDRAIELIQQNTRRYAKRQLTWFRNIQDLNWISGNPYELAEIIAIFVEKNWFSSKKEKIS